MISWRRITEADFPLLSKWLAEPHVAEWWHHDSSSEGVARDFGPSATGEEPGEALLMYLDGRAVGLMQRSCLDDYPEYAAELAAHTGLPGAAVTIDYLIGDPHDIGVGIGSRMIRHTIEATWTDYPDTPAIIVAVSAANLASWRVLEKAGMHRIAEGEMEPDNPAHDRAHYIYRLDRPPISVP
ncbi:GNAT family N-acetyltransferase [Nocardia sp. NPDC058518]|uniref:GNAT family N-acetyltransferase n=1 Tax=Nocardia sp. NPDC058518 TaxID=3346534 RepID=UPI003664FEAC